jgi:NADH:ubiquinone oxidoreductase subunit F (NADH-binding)/(2Fe-2S) ferredoxin
MMMKLRDLAGLEKYKGSVLERHDAGRRWISLCVGTGCIATGADRVAAALRRELDRCNLKNIQVKQTGCPGFCERGPLMVIHPQGILYQNVRPDSVADIVHKTIKGGEVIPELVYTDPSTDRRVELEKDIPFYSRQKRLILGNNPLVDPTDIDDYFAIGGYAALGRVLGGMTPVQVIDEIKRAGLRGRGGAGFPTGVKWETTRKARGQIKYVVCNADEGDPGAFMNRSVLEGNPHSVLEGMMIGAYAIGAREGYIYVRNEYPLAVKNATLAVQQARDLGLLGTNILGTRFDFDISIVRGAGAFVCGEETALMASIEGKKGVPRQRPPFPSEEGLWGRPTNINNVETWANVPLIINKGAGWYSEIGSPSSKGTKIFALVGKIRNTGLVEVPLGTKLSDIIYGIGGGIPDGRKLKAVQCGGPSGGMISAQNIDVAVDYEGLKKYGAMMGSGGLVVMDDSTCMVDIAKYFLKFLLEESCGKCTTCREGIERMHELVTKITEGKATIEDLGLLEELATVVRDTTMCGLGNTSPNPVLTTLRYFKPEYEAHILEKRCPAGVCKALITYSIDPKKCTGCAACAKKCPEGAVSGRKKEPHEIDAKKCIRCGVCQTTCKFGAVSRR